MPPNKILVVYGRNMADEGKLLSCQNNHKHLLKVAELQLIGLG